MAILLHTKGEDSMASGFGVRESIMVPLHPSLAKCA